MKACSIGPSRKVEILAFVIIFVVFPSLLSAIVVSDDPSLHEFDHTSDFNGVGYLSSAGGTTGVLISPNCILTAAHAVSSIAGHTFTLYTENGTETYNLVEKFVDTSIDLAVVRLDRNTPLPGYKINTQFVEVGNEAVLVGFGYSGVGETQASLYPKGVGRYGTNIIGRTYAGLLVYDFDKNRNDVMITTGDSGGPSFMWIDGQWQIIGIHVSVTDNDSDGILAEYGDNGYDVRLADHANWICDSIPAAQYLIGDADHDGVVSAGDYACVQTHFNSVGEPGILGDANYDGIVSAADYASIRENFGETLYQGTLPEPGTLLTIMVGWIILQKRKQ